MPYDVNVVAVRKQLDIFLKNNTIATTKLKRTHDKVSKGSEGFISTFRKLQKLLNVIPHTGLISLKPINSLLRNIDWPIQETKTIHFAQSNTKSPWSVNH